LNNFSFVAFKYRYTRVGGTKVNTDDLTHVNLQKFPPKVVKLFPYTLYGFGLSNFKGVKINSPYFETLTIAGRTKRPFNT
ncbi:MAG: hypothetical protein RL143_1361, partial [Pseudomonadota bacterium]